MSTRKLGSRISRAGMALKTGLLGAGLFAVALGCGDRAGLDAADDSCPAVDGSACDGVYSQASVATTYAKVLTFSRKADVWVCDQSGGPVESAAFADFLRREYADFARSSGKDGVYLHFAPIFPRDMPCALHHFALTAMHVQGIGTAYCRYESREGILYGSVRGIMQHRPAFAGSRDFAAKGEARVREIEKRKGMVLHVCRITDYDEMSIEEVSVHAPVLKVADYVDSLAPHADDGAFALIGFLGIILHESLSSRKPEGVVELE